VRIAVTGAAGRVGTHVVELASSLGHTVVAIDRRPLPPAVDVSRYFDVDTTDYSGLVEAMSGCDALIHLAAITGPGREPDHIVHNTNVVSSYNALRAASQVGIRRICQASSINAIGGRFSESPRYDYFPLDERHPTYAEDPYSLSKWVCELQADAISRSNPGMSIASLRLHGVVDSRPDTAGWSSLPGKVVEKQLWGYVEFSAVARACLLGVTTDLGGHEVFYIVAPDTMADAPSRMLATDNYPDVPVRGDLAGMQGFFDCAKALSMLGWRHDAQ
jgi:UDP-glucose 4-epimerase